MNDSPVFNRQRIEDARRRQGEILAQRKLGYVSPSLRKHEYPSLRKLGAYGRRPGSRMVFLSKGSGVTDTGRTVSNPGFPFVNAGKPIFAGGLPLGFDRETALEFLREQTK